MRIFFAQIGGFCLNSAWLAPDLMPKRAPRWKPCAFYPTQISNFNCLFVSPYWNKNAANACWLISSLTLQAFAEHCAKTADEATLCFCFLLEGNNYLSLHHRAEPEQKLPSKAPRPPARRENRRHPTTQPPCQLSVFSQHFTVTKTQQWHVIWNSSLTFHATAEHCTKNADEATLCFCFLGGGIISLLTDASCEMLRKVQGVPYL